MNCNKLSLPPPPPTSLCSEDRKQQQKGKSSKLGKIIQFFKITSFNGKKTNQLFKRILLDIGSLFFPMYSFSLPLYVGVLICTLYSLISWPVTWLFIIGSDQHTLWGSVLYGVIRLQYWLQSSVVEYMTSPLTVIGPIFWGYVSHSINRVVCNVCSCPVEGEISAMSLQYCQRKSLRRS